MPTHARTHIYGYILNTYKQFICLVFAEVMSTLSGISKMVTSTSSGISKTVRSTSSRISKAVTPQPTPQIPKICGKDSFSCPTANHLCFPLAFKCDGHSDCPDSYDEEHCGKNHFYFLRC